MYRSWHRVVAAILLICFPVAVFAQTGFFGTEDDEPTMVAQQESMFGEEQEAVNESSGGSENPIQNAILEGIQLSSEPGEREDEVIISGYFIFRDKPTSYFYETNLKEKKMVFEFNDTEMGSSPIPSAKQPPIKGFRIEQTEVNVNEDIQGLKPEWHDVVKVSFFMDAIPHITVKDEYSIVSFSFKWSTDPEKLEEYVQESKTGKVVLFSVLGLGAVGGGLLAYFLTNQPPPPEEEKPLGYKDLPVHPESHQ